MWWSLDVPRARPSLRARLLMVASPTDAVETVRSCCDETDGLDVLMMHLVEVYIRFPPSEDELRWLQRLYASTEGGGDQQSSFACLTLYLAARHARRVHTQTTVLQRRSFARLPLRRTCGSCTVMMERATPPPPTRPITPPAAAPLSKTLRRDESEQGAAVQRAGEGRVLLAPDA